jgi:hypothetical protein
MVESEQPLFPASWGFKGFSSADRLDRLLKTPRATSEAVFNILLGPKLCRLEATFAARMCGASATTKG